jgi:DNA-binding NarL/FixJ family response regulator
VGADGYRRLIWAGLAAHAQRLFLSEHTVHRYLANILPKLNLSSRAAAAAWGCAPGWYEPGPVGPSAAAG